MKEIRGDAKNLLSLLSNAKFAIDYYQREYQWKIKQIAELLNDLCGKFLDSHKAKNPRSAVKDYGHYFLGSIIISEKNGRKFIIDGQQRLTSLTLLLIHIYRQVQDEEQKGQIGGLIFSYSCGKRSFNLDVEERIACMTSLYKQKPFNEEGQPKSVVNILNRYRNIQDQFPSEIDAKAMPYFADWLVENVHLVEITAYSDADAYTIFETMNDRGLSLTPTDMLKGYLLANINDTDHRNDANRVWRDRIRALQNIGKEESADAIKGWLRSQHATNIRKRNRGAKPRDFDLIGTEFHRWVRDNKRPLGLNHDSDFARFIKEDFDFYGHWHARIHKATKTLTDGLEAIHYNAQNNFTLQYPVLLAPLERTDNEACILQKLRIVASYIDILIARRVWNSKSTSYSTMQYNMFQLVILKIRRKPVAELAQILTARLNAESETFATNKRFALHGQNGPQIRRLLARITDFVGTESGLASHYTGYVRGKEKYEVEHIWAKNPEPHTDEFSHPTDFHEYRNRIGCLLLLPKKFNASYGDKSYEDKYTPYFGQNILAQSLNENAYKNNPGFQSFIKKTGLAFRAHTEFKKADLDARQDLYQAIAEQIWNPANLSLEVNP